MNKGANFIKKGEIENALFWTEEVLTSYLKETNAPEANIALNNLIVLSSRYKKLKKEIQQGIIKKDDEEVRHNKILIALLEQINCIPNWILENSFEFEEDFSDILSNFHTTKNKLQIIKKIKHYIEHIKETYSIPSDLDSNLFNKKITQGNISIGIIGAFNTGKSSLINTLLERKVLPSTLTPSHYGILILEWGENEFLEFIENGVAGKRYKIDEGKSILLNKDEEFRNKDKFNPEIIRIVLNEFFLKGKRIIEFCPTDVYTNLEIGQQGYFELQKTLMLECSILLSTENATTVGMSINKREINSFKDLFGDNHTVVINMIDRLIYDNKNYFNEIYVKARRLYGEKIFFISNHPGYKKRNDIIQLKEFIKSRSEKVRIIGHELFLRQLIYILNNIRNQLKGNVILSKKSNNSIHFELKFTLSYVEKLIFELKISREIVKAKI